MVAHRNLAHGDNPLGPPRKPFMSIHVAPCQAGRDGTMTVVARLCCCYIWLGSSRRFFGRINVWLCILQGATIMYTIVSALVKDLAIVRLWPKMLLVVSALVFELEPHTSL